MEFLKKKKFLILGVVLGIIGGFAYWNFIGCSNGTCMIQSNAYMMTGYGAIMGFALGGIVQSYTKS
ncbi:MAG TPA: hypothetical protein VK004_01580 [Ignavibacteria bacterium]|nr:hypothetical protein [Ignavibacteria bacterium]